MKRNNFTTLLRADLIKKLKLLAIIKEKKMNDLIEEAIHDLWENHKKEFMT